MRIGIPLLEDRVAPRCTFADSVLLVSVRHRRVVERTRVPMDGTTWADLARVLGEEAVETIICGGISRPTRESIEARGVSVIDNVVGPVDAVVDALRRGKLESGFGLSGPGRAGRPDGRGEGVSWTDAAVAGIAADPAKPVSVHEPARSRAGRPGVDCLACDDRLCLRGLPCPRLDVAVREAPELELRSGEDELLESARDVAFEEERALCRLAELVYFALGAGYERLGVAFCVELLEPATILTRVLRRFFDVLPVCCRVGGGPAERPEGPVPGGQGVCDPLALAAVLNAWNADLNVVVGLCVGVDCVFARASRAPVTTIFVKDRSLANNPIGAVYSHYHLRDI